MHGCATAEFLREIQKDVFPWCVIKDWDSFLVLTDLADAVLPKVEKLTKYGLQRVAEVYSELSFDAPNARWPMILVSQQEHFIQYYDSISGDTHEDQPMIPGGIFVAHPVGHFVIPYSSCDVIDGTMAHELVHAACALKNMPQWLEEGMAMGVEIAMSYSMHPFGTSDSQEKLRDHYTHTPPTVIYTNDAFSGITESEYSYELAYLMCQHLLKSRMLFFDFIENITHEDNGEHALRQYYNISLEELAEQSISPMKPKGVIAQCVYWVFGV